MIKTIVRRVAVLVFLGTPYFGSCSRPHMTEFASRFSIRVPADVPIIFVGTVRSKAVPDGRLHLSRYDEQLKVRRWRVEFEVENVINSALIEKIVTFYYFMPLQNYVTNRIPLGFEKGERWLVFLQKDYGELRTICDGWQGCCVMPIFTGRHQGFTLDPSRSESANFTRLFLSRGEHASDADMFKALKELNRCTPCRPEDIIERLKELAHEEAAPVRLEACQRLAQRGYPCDQDKKNQLRDQGNNRPNTILITPSGMHDSPAQN